MKRNVIQFTTSVSAANVHAVWRL